MLRGWTIIACLLAFFALPRLADAGEYCRYDIECNVGQVCLQGQCRAASDRPQYVGAADECGQDRRCRIDRLKRRNQAHRHAKVLEEERRIREMLEREHKKKLDEQPRLKHPFTVDLRISRLGVLGLGFGWTYAGSLRFEGTFVMHSRYVSVYADDGSFSVDGNQDAMFLAGNLGYFLLDGWFSPYLSAGFMYGTGKMSSYGYFGSTPSLRTEYHAAQLGGGVDLQLAFGLHTRLGMAYRPLVYNQARISPGQYDEATRNGLQGWWSEEAAFDVIWMLGWAFSL